MLHASLRYPLVLFFVLLFVIEWVVVLSLVPLSPMAVGLIALVPTPVALLTAALVEGRKGPGNLMRRSLRWRANLKWYGFAILIPFAIHFLAAAGALLAGVTPAPRPEAFLVYIPLTLILAAGEEIGWQGYAMPKLRAQFSPLSSGLIFGILHASFHLPMYWMPLPAELRQASPFPLFLLLATAFALYRVWFYEHTDGNVPLIIVYHAAINTSVLLLAGVNPALLGWLLPVVWILAVQPLLVSHELREAYGN